MGGGGMELFLGRDELQALMFAVLNLRVLMPGSWFSWYI